MSLRIYDTLDQGTPAWHAARCGLLTASEIGQLLSEKTHQKAQNKDSRALVKKLAAQRLTGQVDETSPTFAMQRGHEDEEVARAIYSEQNGPVEQIGFMTRTIGGTTLGYSPDGLVGAHGLIEIKSCAQHLQLDTILAGDVPPRHRAQVQTALLVSGRDWLDYISFPAMGGGPMMVKRILPDLDWQGRLIEAALDCEVEIAGLLKAYHAALIRIDCRFIDTQRRTHCDAEPEFTL